MQAAIGPLDTVVHGLDSGFAGQHRMKGPDHLGAVLGGQQVQVLQVFRQRLARVEAEQGLSASGPADPAGIDFPAPGAQPGCIEGRQQLRRAVPALFRFLWVQGVDAGQGWHGIDGVAHYQRALAQWAFGAVSRSTGHSDSCLIPWQIDLCIQ